MPAISRKLVELAGEAGLMGYDFGVWLFWLTCPPANVVFLLVWEKVPALEVKRVLNNRTLRGRGKDVLRFVAHLLGALRGCLKGESGLADAWALRGICSVSHQKQVMLLMFGFWETREYKEAGIGLHNRACFHLPVGSCSFQRTHVPGPLASQSGCLRILAD